MRDPNEDPNVAAAGKTAKLRTKIRRLYDVANIFVSIGLVRKVKNENGLSNAHKPIFEWVENYEPKTPVSRKSTAATQTQPAAAPEAFSTPMAAAVLVSASQNNVNRSSATAKKTLSFEGAAAAPTSPQRKSKKGIFLYFFSLQSI